jgi:TonB family protein
MKIYLLFLLVSFTLHGSVFFYFSVQTAKQESNHRVLLVSTKSYKNSATKAEAKAKEKSIGNEQEEVQGEEVESTSNLPASDQPVQPQYPTLSRLKGEEGENLLRFKIDSVGKAYEISLLSSSGFERLDQASIKAIQEAQFHDNNKTDHSFELRFKFTLKP